MRKKIFLGTLACVAFIQLHAQQKDSLSVDLNSVEISAVQKKLYSEMGRIVTVIEKAEITRSAVQSLDQLLDYVAGIDIRQRGTNTTQADISVHGGSFDQVLVLLNGVNITDPQTGHFNLDVPLNLSDIKRIEVLEGSAARVLGPNAFSGAINIITENSEKQSLEAELTVGSYVTLGQAISGNFSINNINTFASVSHKNSNGYISNTDFNYLNGFIQSSLTTTDVGKFELQLATQLKDFGANSFYSLAYPNQYENSKTFMAALSWNQTKDNWTYNAQAYWREHHDRFELFRNFNNAAVWYTTHNYHMTDVTGGKFSVAYLSLLGKTTVGIELRNEHIFSNVLGTSIDSLKAPLEKNGYFTKQANRLIETGLIDHSVNIGKWYLSIGAAVTNSTSFGLNSYGGLDIAYAFTENFRMFANANSAVRLPTFTDLYYKSATQLANPNLLPERSQTIEIGTKMVESNWKLDADVYYRLGQNVIDWVKLPSETIWQSENLTNVNALGGDLSLSYFFEKSFIKKISVSYSYLQMNKSADNFDSKYVLDYLKNKFIASISHNIWSNLSATWNVGYYDREGTFTDANKNIQKFEPYALVDCRLLWANGKVDIFADLNNILNAKYADYGGLAQPGINFNVGVRKRL